MNRAFAVTETGMMVVASIEERSRTMEPFLVFTSTKRELKVSDLFVPMDSEIEEFTAELTAETCADVCGLPIMPEEEVIQLLRKAYGACSLDIFDRTIGHMAYHACSDKRIRREMGDLDNIRRHLRQMEKNGS